MQDPTVSFIVPCYKLAHFLKECVNSILSQSYSDFEIIIMDDCSPDNTPEVAASFQDERILYIRNEPNLGHLRNYNKGIELSRGHYIWLISADDRLRSRHILERYVELMDKQSKVGYVFCPGIGLQDGAETKLLDHYYYGNKDQIFDGPDFIATVLRKNGGLLSPSVMVRRECYERISMFPLDMPHEGDLYLWFIWALEYDVAYLAEPMVNYRTHDLSMMKDFLTQRQKEAFSDDVGVMWQVKARASKQGSERLVHQFESMLANKYANSAAVILYNESSAPWGMTIDECENELRICAKDDREHRRIKGKFHAYLGDKHWWHGDFLRARRSYIQGLRLYWALPRVWLKMLVAGMGRIGFSIFKETRERLRQRRINFGQGG